MRRTFFRTLTRIHKWAGLILAVQIFLWFSSGLFFTIFPIETVRGNHLVDRTPLPVTATDLLPTDYVMALYDGDVRSVTLRQVSTVPIYRISGSTGDQLFRAKTGAVFHGPDKDMAAQIAEQHYIGKGLISEVNLISDKAPLDYRGALPVWQAIYDDKDKTRLYIDAKTGELSRVRTKLWRVFDTMWMFHIMDYDDREDIDNWWFKLAAFLAWLFALTGIGLLFHRFVLRPRRRQ